MTTLKEYAQQTSILKRLVLALPATDGPSVEFRSAAIEQLNVCLRIGASAKKAQQTQDKARSRMSLDLDFAEAIKGIEHVRAIHALLHKGDQELDKLRRMLNTPLAKAKVPSPENMTNRQVAEYLGIMFGGLLQGKDKADALDRALIHEAMKRLSM